MYKDEYWQLDEEWLLKHLPEATQNQIDAFCEKVANFILNDNMDEVIARLNVLQMIQEGLVGQ